MKLALLQNSSETEINNNYEVFDIEATTVMVTLLSSIWFIKIQNNVICDVNYREIFGKCLEHQRRELVKILQGEVTSGFFVRVCLYSPNTFVYYNKECLKLVTVSNKVEVNVVFSKMDSVVDFGFFHGHYLYINGDGELFVSKEKESKFEKLHYFDSHDKAITMSFGFEHALILTSQGKVYSIGNGTRGQLGIIDTNESWTQLNIVDSLYCLDIKEIASGGWHSVSLTDSGDVFSWGLNNFGQLGVEGMFSTSIPVLVDFLRNGVFVDNISHIFCSSTETLVIDGNGDLWFIGQNYSNNLIDHCIVNNNVMPKKQSFHDGVKFKKIIFFNDLYKLIEI